MKLIRPGPNVKAVVFYSFGEGVVFSPGVAGGQYYDSLSIENPLNPQTLPAYEMNYQPLNHLHGAPVRLRVENQLGFKMVKWIQAIEFVIFQGGHHGRNALGRVVRTCVRLDCEVDLRGDTIRFHALRRREPRHQPLLRLAPYVFPRKPFHE